ncbi:MAG: DUF2156 domain-containing protein [Clostridia bacterium]|nr:DUF2156 domain-containing protein [Clostridia bacterium]
MEATERFKTLNIADKPMVDSIILRDTHRGCDYCFGNNFLWSSAYKTEFAVLCGAYVPRYKRGILNVYNYPAGALPDRINAARYIIQNEKRNWCFRGLDNKHKEELEKYFPDMFIYYNDRNAADYLYSSDKLISLAGKKLQSKRNHIRRFEDEPDWCFEEINNDNIRECRIFSEMWYSRYGESREDIEFERSALDTAFDYFNALGLCGGIIRRKGEVVAFSIGEPICTDTFCVHFEKAVAELRGAYAIINREFAKRFCGSYRYINREEDMGHEGLRKAKLSYYPDMLLEKYIAVPIVDVAQKLN